MSEVPTPTPIDAPERPARPTVIVPVDDSERSRRAVVTAATEFDDVELVVLYVLEPYVAMSVTEPAVWDDEFAPRREREAKRVLEDYRDLAASHGADVRTELARETQTRAIINASEKFGADRAIVARPRGTGFRGKLTNLLLEIAGKRALTSVTIVDPRNAEGASD
ncbi:universal stress protein [Halosolutus gelatinilyticus]|uniref:universal stress protein n=1 Tax=Halosolutus gelatinilyticus TaxID=2931975 RepID=UPI001FF6B157|nr:universal stress protein [Halosolutus gelatinilyticus]